MSVDRTIVWKDVTITLITLDIGIFINCCLQGLCGLCLWFWPKRKMRMILRIKMMLQKWRRKNGVAKMMSHGDSYCTLYKSFNYWKWLQVLITTYWIDLSEQKRTRAIQCFCVSVSVCVILYLAHTLPKKFSVLWNNHSHYANFSQSYNFQSRCGKYGVLRKIHFGIKFSFWEF